MTQRIQDTDAYIMMEAARASAANPKGPQVLKPHFARLVANGHSPQDAASLLQAAIQPRKEPK